MSDITIKGSLKILNPENIKKEILKALRRRLSRKLKAAVNDIERDSSVVLLDAILGSTTAKSLFNGSLREELGITDTSQVYSIIQIIANNLQVRVDGPKISGQQIRLKIRLEAIPKDFNSKLPGIGSYQTEKGQSIDWLKWLTELGDSIIVREYDVRAGFPKSSRTGDKIMVKGKGWRVPPEHAGSQSSNFITKACDSALGEIAKYFILSIERALK